MRSTGHKTDAVHRKHAIVRREMEPTAVRGRHTRKTRQSLSLTMILKSAMKAFLSELSH